MVKTQDYDQYEAGWYHVVGKRNAKQHYFYGDTYGCPTSICGWLTVVDASWLASGVRPRCKHCTRIVSSVGEGWP